MLAVTLAILEQTNDEAPPARLWNVLMLPQQRPEWPTVSLRRYLKVSLHRDRELQGSILHSNPAARAIKHAVTGQTLSYDDLTLLVRFLGKLAKLR